MQQVETVVLQIPSVIWPISCSLGKIVGANKVIPPHDKVDPPRNKVDPPPDKVNPPRNKVIPPHDKVDPPPDKVNPPCDNVNPLHWFHNSVCRFEGEASNVPHHRGYTLEPVIKHRAMCMCPRCSGPACPSGCSPDLPSERPTSCLVAVLSGHLNAFRCVATHIVNKHRWWCHHNIWRVNT